MTRLESIIRFKKRALDEERKTLAELEKKVADVEADLTALAAEEASESTKTDLEVSATELASYLKGVRYRRAAFEDTRAEREEAAEDQRERVRMAFEELKTLELAEERHNAEAARQEAKQAQIELDEIALRQHGK